VLALHLPHRLGDNDRQALGKVLYGPIQEIDLPVKAVDFFLDPVEARLDGCEIVAVAPGLFKNMSRHQLLALDLVFEDANMRLEFFLSHMPAWKQPAQNLQINRSTGCGCVHLLLCLAASWGPSVLAFHRSS
jgi:hypothetical protein